MIKHIILWRLKPDFSESEKEEILAKIKTGFANLNGKIDGMISISANVNPLPSSSCDLMLDSVFENTEALQGYQKNPLHLEVATVVRSVVSERVCFDYEV